MELHELRLERGAGHRNIAEGGSIASFFAMKILAVARNMYSHNFFSS